MRVSQYQSVFEEFKHLLLAVWSADRGSVLSGAESARLRKSLVAHGAKQFLQTSGQQACPLPLM